MSELEKGILEIILKSQLQIENAVLEALEPSGDGIANDTLRKATNARLKEIRRQISVLETHRF